MKKRIAGTLVILTLASATTIASAADTPFPSSVPDEYPLSQEFPNVVTYQQEHLNGAITQATTTYPTSVPDEYSLASEFPKMTTYADLHRDRAADRTNATPDQASSGRSVGAAG